MEETEASFRLKRGEISGLEVLVRAHQVRAVRAAYLVCWDRAIAEDVVQGAFVRVYERIGQFDESREFAPWFMRIVVNDATKAAIRNSRNVWLDDEDTSSYLKDAELSHDELMERAEVRDRVWDALAKLPPKQRAVIVERYYLGMSEAEMSERGGLPKGTVKWRLHAAKKKLRQLLKPDIFAMSVRGGGGKEPIPTTLQTVSAKETNHE